MYSFSITLRGCTVPPSDNRFGEGLADLLGQVVELHAAPSSTGTRRPASSPPSPAAPDGKAAERRHVTSLGREPAGGSDPWPTVEKVGWWGVGHWPLAGDGWSPRPEAASNPRNGCPRIKESPEGATDA